MKHSWRLVAADAYTARWVCSRCGCLKQSTNQATSFPKLLYRLPSGVEQRNTAPPCGIAASPGALSEGAA